MGKPVAGIEKYCALRIGKYEVLVDFCDLAVIDPFNICWTIITKGNTRYATAKIMHEGSIKNVYMHRLILGHPPGHTDHVDRNGLNNRRINLRVGTAHQNWVNSGPRKRGKSKYKGVSWVSALGKWRATIQKDRQWQQIGIFVNEKDAARAYDNAAFNLFGPTAYLNKSEFPL
jgi:hypothetical protein